MVCIPCIVQALGIAAVTVVVFQEGGGTPEPSGSGAPTAASLDDVRDIVAKTLDAKGVLGNIKVNVYMHA